MKLRTPGCCRVRACSSPPGGKPTSGLAAEEGWLERADASVALDERLAWACTWAWLDAAAGARP